MARAQRAKSLAVNTLRANSGLINDIIDSVIDQWIGGADFESCINAAQDQIATAALASHGSKVRAALGRAGIDMDAVELSPESIGEAIKKKSGLDISDWSPTGILEAVDKLLARRISSETGIQITSVVGANLTDQLKAGVRLALRSGEAKRLLGTLLDRKARRLATLKRLSSNSAEFKKVRNRKYQAKWRETHKLVWE